MPRKPIEPTKIEYNPTFSECFVSEHRYLMLMGGAGSGKSVFAAQKLVARMLNEPGHRFLITRKVSNTIRESVWQLLLNTFEQMKRSHLIVKNKTDRVITYTPNGNQFIFAGMDDPEKLKSITGITGVWCEEISEFDEMDFDQLDLRLRGETQFYKQMIGTFNPVDVDHWLKPKFFDTSSPDVMTHKSTFRDNLFIDDDYKRILLTRFTSNPQWYSIYVNGEWGKPQTGLEFYHRFHMEKHIVDGYELNPDSPIHVTFDFNVVPHVTVCLWQIAERTVDDVVVSRVATQFDEICLPHPQNNTPSAAQRFFAIYGEHRGGVWVYGDPSGKSRDTRSVRGINDFDLIRDNLKQMTGVVMRVQSVAPNVKTRGNWINDVLDLDKPGLQIRIAEKCKVTIDDYLHVKMNADGSKLKQRAKDKTTGVTSEKYGHATDANDYFLTTVFESEFRTYQRGVPDSQKRTFKNRISVRGGKHY